MIIKRASAQEIGKVAIEQGMKTLRMVALEKVREGVSTSNKPCSSPRASRNPFPAGHVFFGGSAGKILAAARAVCRLNGSRSPALPDVRRPTDSVAGQFAAADIRP